MSRLSHFIAFSTLTISLCGCMSSGIVEIEKGKYRAEVKTWNNGENTKKYALIHASRECINQGKKLYVIDDIMSEDNSTYTATVTFNCLSKDDEGM